ncbi:hypothetical protein GF402_06370 [Candidatus Fermentibacteria bacterium]|nr:hypothetical protein [Candidatus Fermentibacteria bacterium]
MMLLTLLLAALAAGGAPEILAVEDRPNDAGDGLHVHVRGLEDESALSLYLLLRRREGERSFRRVMDLFPPLGETVLVDGRDPDYPVLPGVRYQYRLLAVTASGDTISSRNYTADETARGELFHTGTVPVLVSCVLFLGLMLTYFHRARRGEKLYLRPIPGIEAIDEAIGRATEMGKPILYVPGLSTISDVATIASLTILGRVAKKVAEYQTPLKVPNCDPIVYTVAEESVRQAYLEAGRPDAYDEDSVFFLTQSQFAFVAGVNGIMARERPATNFYLGMFWAESLILAETGSLSGAIQIAGTDAVTQLPFFITTCDYTLIGEELYAASAYLGREPKQLGAIKGQDAFKAVIMLLVLASLLLNVYALLFGDSFPLQWTRDVIHAVGGE